MASTKSIYVPDEGEETWDAAAMLAGKRGMSRLVITLLGEYVRRETRRVLWARAAEVMGPMVEATKLHPAAAEGYAVKFPIRFPDD